MGKPRRDRAPSPVKPGDSATRQEVCREGRPTRLGGEDITWPYQVAPRSRRAPSIRKTKPQTPNLFFLLLVRWSYTAYVPVCAVLVWALLVLAGLGLGPQALFSAPRRRGLLCVGVLRAGRRVVRLRVVVCGLVFVDSPVLSSMSMLVWVSCPWVGVLAA